VDATQRRDCIADVVVECAGDNGSDSTSAPARSVTDAAGEPRAGRGTRRSRCTSRKWIDAPMFSSVSAGRRRGRRGTRTT
jgi:hypothetical protein